MGKLVEKGTLLIVGIFCTTSLFAQVNPPGEGPFDESVAIFFFAALALGALKLFKRK